MADAISFDPKAVAERGEEIYREKYKADFESRLRGQFVAIDVGTEKAYPAPTAEQAYRLARQNSPHGVFHLIRVGQPGAFRVSYSANGNLDRLFH